MNARNELLQLLGEINDGLMALSKMEEFIVAYEANSITQGRNGPEQALALSQALSNYYTCMETLFLRISQFFENSLPPDRWHQSLLDKMIVEIPEIRPAVITRETHKRLLELLRFRHFTRYYYSVDYDWDKLRFLLGQFNAVRDAARMEISRFAEVMKAAADA